MGGGIRRTQRLAVGGKGRDEESEMAHCHGVGVADGATDHGNPPKSTGSTEELQAGAGLPTFVIPSFLTDLSFPELISEELECLAVSVFSSPGLFVNRLDDTIGFVRLSVVPAALDPLEQVLCGLIRHILCVFSMFLPSVFKSTKSGVFGQRYSKFSEERTGSGSGSMISR